MSREVWICYILRDICVVSYMLCNIVHYMLIVEVYIFPKKITCSKNNLIGGIFMGVCGKDKERNGIKLFC